MNVQPLALTRTEHCEPLPGGRDLTNTVSLKEDKGFVEQVITWASISYAAGFFIILLHTWRLGLPVLDLVQAVYVWIGVPLTLFLYFANKPWRYFRGRLETASARLRDSLRRGPLQEQINAGTIGDVIAIVGPFVVSSFLAFSLLESINWTKLFSEARYGRAVVRFSRWVFRVWAVISALLTLLSLIVAAAIVVGILMAYVWIVYPRLPQSLGGGAPVRVRIVLDVAKISPDFSTVAGLGVSWNKDGPPVLTSELQLLYKTADGFWLVSEGGAPFLLDKSMVLGLLYSDSSGLTRR